MKQQLLVLLLTLSVVPAARTQVNFAAGSQLGIGFISPPKAVKNYYGFGFNFGAQGNVWFTKYVGSRLAFSYNIFSSDKTKLATDIANNVGADPTQAKIDGGNISIASITLSGIGRYPTEVINPYGVVGFGLHINSVGDITGGGNLQGTLKGESTTKFGIHFGGGAEFNAGTVKPFVELKWVLIFTEGESTSYIPIAVGVNFEFN